MNPTAKRTIEGIVRALPDRILLALSQIDRRILFFTERDLEIRCNWYYGGLKASLNPKYPVERRMLTGRYSPDLVHLALKLIDPNTSFLDIGANVGAISMPLAASMGGTSKVYAFEPGPLTLGRFQHNVSLNPELVPRIQIYQCGLSDKPGTLFWQETSKNPGNAYLNSAGGAIAVPVVRLDDVPEIASSNIRFVKIDVEGMELQVLRGASATLTRFRPYVAFEAMQGARNRILAETGEDIFRGLQSFFKDRDYCIYPLKPPAARHLPATQLVQDNIAVPFEREREYLSRVERP